MRKANDYSQLSEGSIRCRSFGHSWKPYTAEAEGGTKAHPAGWSVTLICDNCGTFKHFMLSKRGEYGEARYTYPDGYLATFFVGGEEKNRMRLEVLSDVLASATPPLRVIDGGRRAR
jgi:hypothetical protein